MECQRILIAEDDAIVAVRLHDMLVSLGYGVPEPVASGEDAVALASAVRPGLILMDITLCGDMSGVEAAARIHEEMDVPVVYIAAHCDIDLLRRAKVTTPYGYLVKPVQERELQATIEMSLHTHAMAKALRESEERYRAVVTNAKDAVYLFDAGTLRIVETNAAFRSLLDYTEAEALGLHLGDIVRASSNGLRGLVDSMLPGAGSESAGRRYYTRSGAPVEVIARASMITCGGADTVCVVAHDITERKHAGELVQENESRLKIILKSIRAGVMIVDAETHSIIEVNDEAARIIGRGQEDIVGEVCHNVVCTGDRGSCPIMGLHRDVDASDRFIMNASGEMVPVITTVRTLTIDGRLRLLETFIDVSGRKKAERALTEERNLLHTVVNSLPHQIYAKDGARRLILSNTCNTASLGFHRDDDLFRHEASARSRRDEDMILSGEVPLIDALEETCDPATGKLVRSLRVTKHPLRDETGEIIGVVGINIDMTREKLAEMDLRESEERFRSIIENIGEGLVILDLNGNIEYVNRAAAELYRYAKEEMIGRTISEFAAPELSGALLDRHFERLRHGKALVFEIDILRGDTERRSLLAAVVARTSADGRLTGAYETFSDITERKHAEGAIAERNRQLMLTSTRAEEHARLLTLQAGELETERRHAEDASRLKSEFVANLSHEIRTPLNGIIGMTSLLAQSSLNAQQSRFLSVINSSSNSLLAIINDILDFSKIEAGNMELKATDFNLRAELESTTDIFWHKAKEKGVELACIVDANVPNQLHGDPIRLRQVLTNLVGNAVAFTHKGMIIIRVRFIEENAFGAVLTFSVSDTGIGIPREAMSGLFRPFSRMNGEMTREHGGTGLGLAITKRLVDLLGGSITVTSRTDKGTTFRFSTTFAVPGGGEKAAGPRVSDNARKILIAHGNPAARKIMQMMANAFYIPFAMARTGSAVEHMLSAAIIEGVTYHALFIGEALPDCSIVGLLKRIGDDPLLRSIRTVMVGPFSDGVMKTVTRTGGVYTVLDRFSKQSEFFEAYRTVVGGPVSAPASAAPERPASPAVPAEPLNILVVDDNIVNQQVAADLLEAMGCQPDVAWNGQKALEMAAARNYDIIFMDCQMPVMDGYEATRRIHQAAGEEHRGVIIAMTAHAIDGDKEACIAAGMDDYIAKPIRLGDLRLMIEKWRKNPASAGAAGMSIVNKSMPNACAGEGH